MFSRAFIVNQGLFQVSWPACVLGAAYGWAWTGVLVVGVLALWQLNRHNRHPLDGRMVLICLSIGVVLDTAWIQMGLLVFAMPWPWPGVAPFWILLLWLALALVINHSMATFKRRLRFLAVMGLVGSPMSYYAGSRFGAVEWVAPAWQVVVATGVSWALLLPGLFWLAAHLEAKTVASHAGVSPVTVAKR